MLRTSPEEGVRALTEKEKQTLRLIVRGHDAKSVARDLGLSVHTINERLRDARRKMAVSSSREAARMLLAAEGGLPAASPDLLGDTQLGADATPSPADQQTAPINGAGAASRQPWIIVGVIVMTLALGLLTLTALPLAAPVEPPAISAVEKPDPHVVDAAQQWLTMLDSYDWDATYRATGTTFQKLNSAKAWAETSEQARRPLGTVLSRSFIAQENLYAPPRGYQLVKFRTTFANKANVVENVTLEREGEAWRVVGIIIEG